MRIILASTSPFRGMLLRNAGIKFEAIAAAIDERAIEAPLVDAGASPADVAESLAQAKALDVSHHYAQALIIGGDQTLSLNDVLFHKSKNKDEARHRLLSMSGTTHQLNSAISIAHNGAIVWSHVSTAHMHMRTLSPEFIDRYIAEVGDNALASVGAYQIEGPGIQLFERIDGDYFTIVGLPLLPLLEKLRELKIIDG